MPVRELHATKLNREESPMSDTNIAVVKKIYKCFDAGEGGDTSVDSAME